MKGIFDVSFGEKGKNIGIPIESMDGMKVRIKVNEEAKGR